MNLQWQNDQAPYLFIPLLEWIDGQGVVDDMGRGLLSGLRETHARGVGPADGLDGDTWVNERLLHITGGPPGLLAYLAALWRTALGGRPCSLQERQATIRVRLSNSFSRRADTPTQCQNAERERTMPARHSGGL